MMYIKLVRAVTKQSGQQSNEDLGQVRSVYFGDITHVNGHARHSPSPQLTGTRYMGKVSHDCDEITGLV